MRDPNILEIDGSAMEGGGQILRISISLSAILGIPVRIIKIRAGRSKPGLARQHLTGIQLVAQMCGAKLQGASLGSTEVEFSPNKLKGGHYSFDVQTAGSVSLLLQVALPCALLADAPTTLDLIGGTNADMAPQIDYMSSIFKHQLNKFGADFDLTVMRRGFFPKGGGRVQTSIKPVRVLKAVDITNRGEVTSIYGTSAVAGNLPLHLARQSSEGAKSELRSEGEVFIEVIKEERNYAPDNGHFIQLQCETSCGCLLGADALGGPRKEAGEVGRAAGRALRDVLHSGACLDLHAQDQVILYMALAEGRSAVRVGHLTLHTQTAIYIAEMIANVKFEIREDGAQNVIECTGLGFINKSVQSS